MFDQHEGFFHLKMVVMMIDGVLMMMVKGKLFEGFH
jgi:hypothetical protein